MFSLDMKMPRGSSTEDGDLQVTQGCPVASLKNESSFVKALGVIGQSPFKGEGVAVGWLLALPKFCAPRASSLW